MIYCDCRRRSALDCIAVRFALTATERADYEANNAGCSCRVCHQPADVDAGAVAG